ncbi:uncharacterized protein PGTG_18129 [Puccinia graminis f. sp. tritici CRL 75-36-700-3]|uniref:Uncharacterized protein n=1 Tax=Puccinia graminis f. sp. tritici (strain CRL 75-36-700-3 / race SCCL) TaxID=418459 RepID=E3L664_PUCGT|nr:uncharacterized protein PGTG_18129 [Puccinia graminis f. sp. tritici CRL 75-36-700-3]EFP92039.1 hypothetical protein PGTG_18129 [Puccinia graminis f. sp. tritici CRL 75-36-700-3]
MSRFPHYRVSQLRSSAPHLISQPADDPIIVSEVMALFASATARRRIGFGPITPRHDDTGAEEYDAEETDDGERACPNECSGVRGVGGKKGRIHRDCNEDEAWVGAFLRGGPDSWSKSIRRDELEGLNLQLEAANLTKSGPAGREARFVPGGGHIRRSSQGLDSRLQNLLRIHPRGTSCRAGSWNRRNSADPWNRRDQLCKSSVRTDFVVGSTNRAFLRRRFHELPSEPIGLSLLTTGRYGLKRGSPTTSPCGLVVEVPPRPASPPVYPGSTPTGFLFEAPAVSAAAALPELTWAPRGNFGGVPWMGGWSPQKTVDRQLLVRPAAVATRGIHGQKWCPTTLNCARVEDLPPNLQPPVNLFLQAI